MFANSFWNLGGIALKTPLFAPMNNVIHNIVKKYVLNNNNEFKLLI